jgi:hypothetical protein
MSIGGFIGGMILAAVGFMFVWRSDWLLQNFGAIGFAEKYLHGDGGSRLMYKIFGILIVTIGFLIATDLMDTFLEWAVSSIFGRAIQK